MEAFKPMKNWKPWSLFEAITHYNSPFDYVRDECQSYLFDYFMDDLLEKYNEDKPDDEKFYGYSSNDKFVQFAYDYLNLLFQKD